MVIQMMRVFTEKEVMPIVSRMDHACEFPKALVEKLGAMGLMGAFIPEAAGGSGMDLLTYVLAMEEISKAWASLGVIMTVNNSLVCDPIHRFGNMEQHEKYLKPLAQGKLLGCYALTEPEAGSDPGAMTTSATEDGDVFILNGTKRFITNGSHADIAIVYAVTDPVLGKKGISAFIVETDTPGFVVEKIEEKLGLQSSDTAELVFQDCRVPKENLLGELNKGFKIALATLDGGRIGIAAQSLGIAQACLEAAVGYAKKRSQFGKTISNFQAIQWMLADMKTELDAARLLTFHAASLRQSGEAASIAASKAKLYASEMCNRAAYKAIQVFGGYGYMKEFPVERYFRDARVTTLYEGTSEIQRMVIAKDLLK
ncbi:Acyl-CoA dehydrogenase [hydrothermal vent metagenome]|uniref:Acyl-CoA dehydrogenase n=1 Tax=hydrothermal vent metagenome TaxID=652676 RepID=A0A3B1CTH7_9ZZZZ